MTLVGLVLLAENQDASCFEAFSGWRAGFAP
jgi:hypothetical protein